jgi:hypothetical protein
LHLFVCNFVDFNQVWVATQVEFRRGRMVRTKNEALFSGRMPHVRPSVHEAEKDGAQPLSMLCYVGEKSAAKSKNPCAWSESI